MASSFNDSPTGFDRFGFDAPILRGVVAGGFVEPRPIQVDTIPAALAGRDVLGLAQTGTGKTAAFALPLLQRLGRERRRGPGALVLAPTRELAAQIDAEIRTLARFTQLQVATVFGGVSAHGQIRALRRHPEIVVGCPGRILDLLGRGVLHLGEVECVVLDEADHMFDMGFLPDLRRILAALPRKRQNLLFSATMPAEIRALADVLLRDPHVVELDHSGPATTIDHALVAVREDRKRDLLERILREDGCKTAIVFTRTKHRARRLAQQLDRAGHRAVGLQGNMSQSQRTRAMQGFRKRTFDVLVATDIAARGIDVQGVSHVINFDVPNTPDAYTQRIGRTGRAEREGQALTFVTHDDTGWLRATERKLGNPIPRRTVEGFEEERIDAGDRRRPSHRVGRHGRNTSSRSGDAARPQSHRRRRSRRASARPRRRQS
ncbi:MAG TPA: DEAD/DEAH box helicase [Acidobacteriota bacterium]|nr:DEAD/DEAH box helicase [Acidobacteriota bacterium]